MLCNSQDSGVSGMQIGDWNSDRWYLGLIIASVLVLGASAAVSKLPSDVQRGLIWLSLGGIVVGLAEWSQHRLQTRLSSDLRYKITGYPRRATIAGTAFDMLGAVMVGRGLWLMW